MAADTSSAAGEERRTLVALSARHRRDGSPDEALGDASRVVLRTMGVGTWELLPRAAAFGPVRLAAVLRGATAAR